MSNEEIRSRERIRDIVALRLTSQRAALRSKVQDLHVSTQRSHIAKNNFELTWRSLRSGKLDNKVAPLVVAELDRREKSLRASIKQCKATQSETDTEAIKLRRLEAMYSNLTDQLEISERGVEERGFEEALEDRISSISDASKSGTQNLSSPSVGAEIGFQVASWRQDSGEKKQSSDFKDKAASGCTDSSRSQSIRPLVRDLKNACFTQQVELSQIDTWKRLDDVGVRLKLKLANGKQVAMSIFRRGANSLTVQLSRSALPSGSQAGEVRSAIVKALGSQGLTVKQFLMTDEG